MRFLYRENGGQTTSASTDPNAFSDVGPAQNDPWDDSYYFNVATDPDNQPHGDDLSPAKLYDPVTDTLRNASAAEIANFAVAEAEDENLINRELGKLMINALTQAQSKLVRCLVDVIVDELNIHTGSWNIFRAEVAASSSMADLKSRIANNTSDRPVRTLGEVKTAILNRIDSGVND
jgi:hypothetical protein